MTLSLQSLPQASDSKPVNHGHMFSDRCYVGLLALSIISGLGLTSYVLSFTSLHQTFFNENLSQIYLSVSITAAVVGFGLMLHTQGSFRGSSHWKYVQTKAGKNYFEEYIDLSVQDKNGYVPTYRVNRTSLRISIMSFIAAPFYAVATIVYHCVRIPFSMIYLFIRSFYDGIHTRKLSVFGARLFQMIEQPLISLSVILRTPFCMTGFMLGHFYSCLDPLHFKQGDALNGRKLASLFERFWGRDIAVKQATTCWEYGVCNGEIAKERNKRLFNLQPDKLGAHSFYLDGCYQSVGSYMKVSKVDSKEFKLEQIVSSKSVNLNFSRFIIIDIDKNLNRKAKF